MGAAEEKRDDFLRRFGDQLQMAHQQIEGGEQVRVQFMVLAEKGVALGEAGASFAAGQSAEKSQGDFLQPDENTVEFSSEPKRRARERMEMSRRRSCTRYVLTEKPKYWPAMSSISCASSKITAL